MEELTHRDLYSREFLAEVYFKRAIAAGKTSSPYATRYWADKAQREYTKKSREKRAHERKAIRDNKILFEAWIDIHANGEKPDYTEVNKMPRSRARTSKRRWIRDRFHYKIIRENQESFDAWLAKHGGGAQ